MEYRKLGSSGIDVSVMALGCWPFAGGKVWGDQDEGDSIATVHAALDAGINFFDTAEGYESGQSERVLGKGLKGRRQEAVIATKVSASNLRPEKIAASCEGSLRNLGTDVIDLYQVHWPNWEIPIEESWRALEKLKADGKVRALGVCNFGVKDLTELLKDRDCQTDQLPYSLLWRAIEHSIQPLCVSRGVGLICYSPLMQGLLTGRYADADEVPEGLGRTRLYAGTRPMAQHGEAGCEGEVFEAVGRFRALCEDLGEPMAEVALAWVRGRPGVTSFLVGARTPAELQWNLPSLDLDLSDDTTAELDRIFEPVKSRVGENPDMWMSKSRMR